MRFPNQLIAFETLASAVYKALFETTTKESLTLSPVLGQRVFNNSLQTAVVQ